MRVHRSNRSEQLVDMLVEVLARAPADPMAPEWIVVQSRGMERWLSQELSRRLGVWAQPCFPFPRALIERLLAAAEPDASAVSRGDEQALVWSVAASLTHHAEHPELTQLGHYLGAVEGPARNERLFQLAERIARRFDDYALYRGELVAQWDAGEGEGWQPYLWRQLAARHAGGHVAARAERYFSAARAGRLRLDGLGARLCLFGVGTLPPLYLRMLQALPDSIDVHLFVVNPCREYWGLIRPQRSIDRRLATQAATPVDAMHYEIGNPLLATFGRLGRELAELLEASGAVDGTERYPEPADTSLLGALQYDILTLRDPHRGSTEHPPRVLADADESLSIHSCHSPTRELQVLHDRLLDLLARDDGLEPRDIVVMAPDIEAYAPVIEAVFGAREGQGAIPYQVADRGFAATHEVVDAWLALLEIFPSRMGAGHVLDLLGYESIRRRFGIDAEDLEACREWVVHSGVRWGMDAAHRESEGQPPLDGNTWQFGLDRLLLGRAFDSDAGLYFGRLACDGVEGSETSVLGKLAAFVETLFRASRECLETRSVARWAEDLGVWLDRLLLPSAEAAFQVQAVRDALALLVERATRAGFEGSLDLATLGARLGQALDEVMSPRLGARGFLGGGVTFCQLTPMRSIPFRVVCLLGMNDEAFPRVERTLSFDLMATSRRPGDRSRRDDDRYLFLEALLSARERLLISYVGQGVQDNELQPPSVAILELIDAVRRGFLLPGHDESEGPPSIEAYEARLVVRHPLQPFSPRYFRAHMPGDPDARLFSYAAHYCEGARTLVAPLSVVVPNPGELPPVLELTPGTDLQLDLLDRYLTHPSRAYLQRQLGVYFGDDAEPVEEREPVTLDALERWELGTSLLGQDLSSGAGAQVLAVERARGSLPLGTPGQLALQGELPLARALVARGAALRAGERPTPRAFVVDVGSVRLVGTLDGLSPSGRVLVQRSKQRGNNELRTWIRHLVLNCLLEGAPEADPRRSSHLVAPKDGAAVVISFAPTPSARAELAKLVALLPYAQSGLLPLFKGASRTYAEVLRKTQDRDRALDDAYKAFEEDQFADVKDPYVRQLFPSFDALLAIEGRWSFEAVARAVFDPLLALRGSE